MYIYICIYEYTFTKISIFSKDGKSGTFATVNNSTTHVIINMLLQCYILQ